jgi:hypothetical protein
MPASDLEAAYTKVVSNWVERIRDWPKEALRTLVGVKDIVTADAVLEEGIRVLLTELSESVGIF